MNINHLILVTAICCNLSANAQDLNKIILATNKTPTVANIAKHSGRCLTGTCNNEYSEWISNDSNIYYQGNFLNGRFQGSGHLVYFGDHYYGAFLEGGLIGQGHSITQAGDIYLGSFVDGIRSGLGKLFFSNGGYYYGSFEGFIPTGYGIVSNKNGQEYLGFFEYNKELNYDSLQKAAYQNLTAIIEQFYNGYGVYNYHGDSTYSGFIENGHRQGFGQVVDNKGILIKYGYWNNDILSAKPDETCENPQATIFPTDTIRLFKPIKYSDTALKPKKKSGLGYCINRDSSTKYYGPILNGLPYGYGIMATNGMIVHGFFSNGKLCETALVYSPDGIFVGEFLNGEKTKYGKLFIKQQAYYEGTFTSNNIQGEGTIYNRNGNIYVGRVDNVPNTFNGTLNGFGIMRYCSNISYSGNWFKGGRGGYGVLYDNNRKSFYIKEIGKIMIELKGTLNLSLSHTENKFT